MRALVGLAPFFSALALAGCYASASPTPDAGHAPITPDAAVAPVADAEPPADCVVAEARIGVGGGSVSLCGASLVVEPGVLERDVDVTIRTADAPAPPAPYVLVGSAFALAPEVFPGHGRLALPHDGTPDDLELVRLEGGRWVRHGACSSDAGAVRQEVSELGTYALVRDPRALPSAPEGLGSAVFVTVLDGVAVAGRSGATGWATSVLRLDGAEEIVLRGTDGVGREVVARVSVLGGAARAEEVRIEDALGTRFERVAGDGAAEPMAVVIGRSDADAARVRLTGTLRDGGGGEHEAELVFDATIAPRRLAPIRLCPTE